MANSVERFSKKLNRKTDNDTYEENFTLPLFRKSKSFSSFYRGIAWGMGLAATAAISATLGAALAIMSPLSIKSNPILQKAQFPDRSEIIQSSDDNWNSLFNYQISRPINILVMGIDQVMEKNLDPNAQFNSRSDTMLLIRIDPQDHSVKMLSIPRDSRVKIPSVGYTKINDANVEGGPALAAEVVSDTLDGVNVDRYVRITTEAFKQLVDLVGGVEVNVPFAMSYQDVTQKLDIHLEPGVQTLNGDQAEQFARYRNTKYGDIGRVQRQQVLLKALQKRLFSPAILPKLPQAIAILQEHIDTNLSIDEMLALANYGRTLDQEQLKMVLLPGRFGGLEEFDGKSYWIINQDESDRIMQKYFDTSNTVEDASNSSQGLRIAIQNLTDEPGLARRMVNYLAKEGYHNTYILHEESTQRLTTTEIVAQKGDTQSATNIKEFLGLGKVDSSSTGDLESDLTIRLGTDASSLLQ
ncbi:LCP family protein [Chroococcus sp. FPU101]|uniref:LCP family protein n=1 Tax=Chroococcus sp. FPU101 TaxID=1974212 RepID=UPI001A9008F3|nr:LCP family protein [Chroococcus sp. FPU101]